MFALYYISAHKGSLLNNDLLKRTVSNRAHLKSALFLVIQKLHYSRICCTFFFMKKCVIWKWKVSYLDSTIEADK